MKSKLFDILLEKVGLVRINNKDYAGREFKLYLEIDENGDKIPMTFNKDIFIEVFGNCDSVDSVNWDVKVNGDTVSIDTVNGDINVGGKAGSVKSVNGDITIGRM
jgi:hypothetical protein